jgi:hypothetical protein
MVTQAQSDPTIHDRGFVGEQPALVAEYQANRFMFYPAPFWGPVVAGTLFVLSTFVASWYLMLACSVGVTNHMVDLGWGAAIWMWVTSGIAFYFGGMIASMISAPRGFGWLKGAAIWGLAIPLGFIAYSLAASSGVFITTAFAHAEVMPGGATTGTYVHYYFMWAAFITLAIGLLTAIAGSASGQPYLAGTESLAGTATTTAPVVP